MALDGSPRHDIVQDAVAGVACGRIDEFWGNLITGWAFSPLRPMAPVLFVEGRRAELVDWPVARNDVKAALGISANTGFSFRFDGLRVGDRVELYQLVDGDLRFLTSRDATKASVDTNTFRQLDRAASISHNEGSVAVTCWEGSHNPIGRARVLYDVMRTAGRPCVLFAYLFDEFGAALWRPLAESDLDLIVIPWPDREVYHDAIGALGFDFDTVWLCKPRYPTFELASKVAQPSSRLVLDLDDNEEQFAQSIAARTKIYGGPGIGLSRMLTSKIPSRTVASRTLQGDFSGHLVRHARDVVIPSPPRRSSRDRPVVTFIGTVRPHKNLGAAAKAISLINWMTGANIEFRIMGDIAPKELRKELEDDGALVGDIVAWADLNTTLEDADCILTGFPSSQVEHTEIVRYQISSKIGDALAVNRPVLVPQSPSVEDLRDTPGVFLFDEQTFGRQLLAALEHSAELGLPSQFTYAGAYRSFRQAELESETRGRAGEVFDFLGPASTIRPKPTLLLIWKQHDAGIFGRRVDQLARAYARSHPDHDVVVLELMHESQQKDYVTATSSWLSDARLILEAAELKVTGRMHTEESIDYRMVKFSARATLADAVERFLLQHRLFPANTTVVLFPVIRFYEYISRLLEPYTKVVDVVDNQFAWAPAGSEARRECSWQYPLLLREADDVIFNSANNAEFFNAYAGRAEHRCHLFPNWYLLPAAWTVAQQAQDPTPRLIYSGNMNDRVDWGLVMRILELPEPPEVHLVGGAQRAPAGFLDAVNAGAIYHGPRSELETLDIMSRSSLAIMPHVVDEVSGYMNPLKVHMFAATGLHVITTAVPGIDRCQSGLTACDDHDEFIDCVQAMLSRSQTRTSRQPLPEAGPPALPELPARYMQLLAAYVSQDA